GDRSEAAQVAGHVERKAVPGDPASDRDADRRDLPARDPDAGETNPPFRSDAELRERVDEDLLEHAEVPAYVEPELPQTHDRIADELPGAVVRHFAAAVRAEDRDAAVGSGSEMARVRSAPERVDRGMLEQEERVG